MKQIEDFSIGFAVRWADLDANGHVRNSAYLDYSVDVRMQFFGQSLFDPEDRIGPVLQREELVYHREIRADDLVRVDLHLAGVSPDRARFKMVTNIYAGDKLAATVTVMGGWLDKDQRTLRLPTEKIIAVLDRMPRTDAFEILKDLNPKT